jgi:hypothetical protein
MHITFVCKSEDRSITNGRSIKLICREVTENTENKYIFLILFVFSNANVRRKLKMCSLETHNTFIYFKKMEKTEIFTITKSARDEAPERKIRSTSV